MKLFVTGGTGFIGTHFIRQALAARHEVIALRRPGSQPRLPLVPGPRWLDGALDADWSEALQGVEVLVHLASHTPNPPYAPLEECLYWNVFAAMKLARAASEAGVSAFLVAGSCFEYGQIPADAVYIEPTHPLAPTLSYPTSKAAASIAFEGFAREHLHRLKILRVFQVFGEGEQATRLWPSLRHAARNGSDFSMSAGEQVRDFIDVETVASRFLAHLDFSAVVPGEPVVRHVASGKSQTLLEFARYWWQEFGAVGELKPGCLPYRNSELFRLVPHPSSLA